MTVRIPKLQSIPVVPELLEEYLAADGIGFEDEEADVDVTDLSEPAARALDGAKVMGSRRGGDSDDDYRPSPSVASSLGIFESPGSRTRRQQLQAGIVAPGSCLKYCHRGFLIVSLSPAASTRRIFPISYVTTPAPSVPSTPTTMDSSMVWASPPRVVNHLCLDLLCCCVFSSQPYPGPLEARL